MRLAWTFMLILSLDITKYCHSAREEQIRIRAYGDEVEDILVNKLLKEFTAHDVFEKKFRDLNLQQIELNLTQVRDEKVAALREIFRTQEELVQRIAAETENLRNAAAGTEVTADNVTFYDESSTTTNDTTAEEIAASLKKLLYRNAKCGCGYQLPESVDPATCIRGNDYELNSHFGSMAVSYNKSSVHIPTEVYNEGTEVLRDVYTSEGLTEILKREVCSDRLRAQLTRWVYFTTNRGVMRYFPDRDWTDDCTVPDVYDSRIAPWYVQSISSPKDVTILIDNSGSVQGLTLNLFHRMVQNFLDTLSANDFVNIVLFNSKAQFISENCTGLLQATPRNKQILYRWLEGIKTGNLSSFEHGFDLALKTVDRSSHIDSLNANCNPIVVLFNDGSAEYPEAALQKWNSNNDKRVFSFAVGKNFYETETTKQIACRNRGNFRSVLSYTATKHEVQSYLLKINEPLAYIRDKTPKWSLPYKDQLGLGLVMSVSMPVYEDSEGSVTGRSLGVVGTDVHLADLKKVVTDAEMGPEYYSFAFDNNGFVLFHPRLNESIHDVSVAVDFADLEGESLLQVRRDMIDRITDSQTVSREFALDGRYLLSADYKYLYAPVDDTKFSFGLAVLSSKLKRYDSAAAVSANYPDLTLEKITSEQRSDSLSLLFSPPCETDNEVHYNPCEYAKIQDSFEEISYERGVLLQDINQTCDASSQLYMSLLLHAKLSDDLAYESWELNSTVKPGDGLLALYTALDSPSLLRVKFLNFSEQTSQNLNGSVDTIKQDITHILSNPRNSSYFRRALHEPGKTIYSYIPVSSPELSSSTNITNSSDASTPIAGYILASRSVSLTSDPAVTPVVTGVVMDPESFIRNVFNLAYKCIGDTNCTDEELVCKDSETTACFILDEGGFLISSNQEEHANQMNKFFGLVDGEFMRTLINQMVYQTKYVYESQAICERVIDDRSAGMPRYLVPTIADILSFGWWFSSCARMFLYSFIQTAIFTLTSFLDPVASHIAEPTGVELPVERQHCILRSTVMSFAENSGMLSGTVGCTPICDRTFTSLHLGKTNLLLVVADSVQTCREDCSKNAVYSNEAVDVTMEEACANKTKRYRRTPNEQCYDASTLPKELDSECNSSHLLRYQLPSILIAVFLQQFFSKLLLPTV